jgi:hypothetical protein
MYQAPSLRSGPFHFALEDPRLETKAQIFIQPDSQVRIALRANTS